MTKTIVFCTDINEAEAMRQLLVNLNQDLVAKDPRYVMRITGDDNEGKKQLENFITPASPYPTIVTTSELLSGCRLQDLRSYCHRQGDRLHDGV